MASAMDSGIDSVVALPLGTPPRNGFDPELIVGAVGPTGAEGA
jgi:hypothetical protein